MCHLASLETLLFALCLSSYTDSSGCQKRPALFPRTDKVRFGLSHCRTHGSQLSLLFSAFKGTRNVLLFMADNGKGYF